MSDKVETMAYTKSGGVPWHGLGFPVNDNMSPDEMRVAAKCNWGVEKRPLFFVGADGEYHRAGEEFGIVRDSDEAFFSTVGKIWKPTQNEDTFDFFTKYVKAGKMKMETAGSLDGGRYVWALAKVGKGFEIGKKSGDRVNNYLLMAAPHVFGKAFLLQYTGIRVVCWNTFSAAVGSNLTSGREAKREKGSQIFRMGHGRLFDDAAKAEAEKTLGLVNEQIEQFQEAVNFLAAKRAAPELVEEFFCEVWEYDPNKEPEKKEPRVLEQFRKALTYSPGQQLPSAEGTWWGAYNSVTHVVDHELGKSRDTALTAAWMGRHRDTKQRALELALNYADKSKTA